ncbi:hydrogenase maturation protease [Desulfallas thermosapovorans]|uniref:Hydrogenase maturation protease n=1 Tax=Desulfallas thermosapovorans DSM 6562 TaxID=1121431 RepID=A0A5S4ZWW5_9FIRM|nr:hydrogenase maturation protease [Desulfallas thermosapovorans]TYO97309.1 hydrogenase maturation protease [Desulfallas thermosapovorans DSM 6562]
MKHIAVIGLGNVLLKDDGIGPRVVQELSKKGLPPGVQAVDAGGGLWNYWYLLKECRHVIAVDSMQGGGPPGAVYMVVPDQLSTGTNEVEAKPGIQIDHELHFLDALKLAAHYGIKPEVTIIGVEPKEISFALELSPEIEARVPLVLKIIKELCMRYSCSS